jgi:BMFP domain-containing protein YqiC
MELKDSQYQGGLRLLSGVETAVQQVMSGLRKREEKSTLRRRIEEVEALLKKAKRELGLG